jgi:hypothetical protein
MGRKPLAFHIKRITLEMVPGSPKKIFECDERGCPVFQFARSQRRNLAPARRELASLASYQFAPGPPEARVPCCAIPLPAEDSLFNDSDPIEGAATVQIGLLGDRPLDEPNDEKLASADAGVYDPSWDWFSDGCSTFVFN